MGHGMEGTEMERILAAIDFSDTTGAVIQTATALAQGMGATLHIIHTEPPVAAVLNYGIDAQVMSLEPEINGLKRRAEEDQHALDTIRDHIAERGVPVDSTQLEGATTECILQEARRVAADLIVIGTHEHGLFHHLIFGGVRDSLIQQAHCPVLVVPAAAPADAGETT